MGLKVENQHYVKLWMRWKCNQNSNKTKRRVFTFQKAKFSGSRFCPRQKLFPPDFLPLFLSLWQLAIVWQLASNALLHHIPHPSIPIIAPRCNILLKWCFCNVHCYCYWHCLTTCNQSSATVHHIVLNTSLGDPSHLNSTMVQLPSFKPIWGGDVLSHIVCTIPMFVMRTSLFEQKVLSSHVHIHVHASSMKILCF